MPAAAAWIGVPYGTPMSIPACSRPQRYPNGLTTGPLTGQIRPDAEGVESVDPCAAASWPRMRESSAASVFASAISSRSWSRVEASWVF